MTATALLKWMEAEGYTLVLVAGDKIRVRPASRLDDATAEAIMEHKAALVDLLRERLVRNACPTCHRPLVDGACWTCCDRPCVECGRPTGSAFILRCVRCGQRFSAVGAGA